MMSKTTARLITPLTFNGADDMIEVRMSVGTAAAFASLVELVTDGDSHVGVLTSHDAEVLRTAQNRWLERRYAEDMMPLADETIPEHNTEGD